MQVSRLPQDIQCHILSYIHQPQPSVLLEDIKSFVETKNDLLEKYYEFWVIQLNMHEPEDRRWLLNDFFYYTNHYKPTMFGYSNAFYRFFKRMYGIKTLQAVDTFVRKLGKKDLDTQINVVLGLFTPRQREDFCTNSMAS
jgi:hypothetical protein